jgi:predicted transcriptional regulator
MDEDLTREDVYHKADLIVEELLAAAGVTRPPVNAVNVGKHLGILILEERGEGQGRRKRRSAETVLLSADGSEESRQWAAAQAIGERLKPDLLRRLGFDPASRQSLPGESLAGLLAHRLLTPTSWFAADARACGWDVPELKRLYVTAGYEVVAWRLLDLPEPCVITIVENDHVHRRRSNTWRVNKTLQPAERECQRYVHHYSRPRVVSADGWMVQGWPLHEPDWTREILRSVGESE